MSSHSRSGRRVFISSDEDEPEPKFSEEDEVLSSNIKADLFRKKVADKENSYGSLVSSTPMHKIDKNRRFSEENEMSAIFSESFGNMSISSPQTIASDDDGDENGDRSRSLLYSAEKPTMSPFSKKLSQKGDAVSKQKLRERILRKSMVSKKIEVSTPKSKPEKISSRISDSSDNSASMISLNSSSENISSITTESSNFNSKNATAVKISPNKTKSRKLLDMEELLEDNHSISSMSNSSSLKSLELSDKKKFVTPRKSEIISLDSDDDEINSVVGSSIVEENEYFSDDVAEVSNNDISDLVFSNDDQDNEAESPELSTRSMSSKEEKADRSSPSIVVLSDSDDGEVVKSPVPPTIVLTASPIKPQPLPRVSPPKTEEVKLAPKLLSALEKENIEQLESRRSLVMKTLSRVNVSELPDGGAKLKAQLAELNRLIELKSKTVQNPEIEFVESIPAPKTYPIFAHRKVQPEIIVVTSPEKPSRGPIVLEAPKFNPDLHNKMLSKETDRLFGGKMTENRFERVKKVTEKALEGFHQALTSAPDEHCKVDTPRGLKIELMEHQKQGLAWMLWRENQNPPVGILADDMGLGKTLSIISLILHQKNERIKRREEEKDEVDKQRRAAARANGLQPSNSTLIIAPASLIYQWEAEVERRVKVDRLSVHVFHGPKNKRESDAKRLARYDIVITTYNLLATELTEKFVMDSGSDDDEKAKKSRNKISKNSDSILSKIAWDRIVLDEAHAIKNKATSVSKSACRLSGTSRWCLTGTPIHNNLWDLYSLIRFMKVSPFDEEKHWKEFIMVSSQKAADRLNLLVKNLLLRRTKSQICSITQKPLVDLPPKTIEQHDLVLEGVEGKIYDIMFTATRQKVRQMLSEEEDARHVQVYGIHRKKRQEKGEEIINPFNFGPRTINQNDRFQQMTGMLVMLLRLRQACVHMSLTREAVDMAAFENINGGNDEDVEAILEKTMAEMTIHENIRESFEETAEEVFSNTHLSSKLKKLFEIVDAMDLNDKMVIVSQWTTLLEIIEVQLKKRHVKYTCITGKVLPCDRQERVDSFNKVNGGDRIMLLSLTAGGVGLNLIGGNHLVLVDLHWNPALEAQACDRIYRMGQKKNVYIHRLVTKGTIEQRVLDLQKRKLELAGAVLDGAASKKMNKLTMADLKYLFELDDEKKRPPPPRVHQALPPLF